MSNFTRKLRRRKDIKQAQANSKLWTSDDWSAFRAAREKHLSNRVPRQAASRRAYWETMRGIEI